MVYLLGSIPVPTSVSDYKTTDDLEYNWTWSTEAFALEQCLPGSSAVNLLAISAFDND